MCWLWNHQLIYNSVPLSKLFFTHNNIFMYILYHLLLDRSKIEQDTELYTEEKSSID